MRPRLNGTVPPVSRLAFLVALTFWPALLVDAKEFKSTPFGQITGTVLDQNGASIAGASVVLFGAAGLEAQRSITDQQGHFTLEKVIAADYVVSAHKMGFREVRRVLHLMPGKSVELKFQLNVASIFETVTVTPARGQPQPVFEVPQSPVIVTQDELSHRYANILPQALRDVTGVRDRRRAER